MQTIKQYSNYRKYYSQFREVPDGFEIHHIDHDRKNNHINNLVAIPRQLHHDYHAVYDRLKIVCPKKINSEFDFLNRIYDISNLLNERLNLFLKIYSEVKTYRIIFLTYIIENKQELYEKYMRGGKCVKIINR